MKYSQSIEIELINGLGVCPIFYIDKFGNGHNIVDSQDNCVLGIHITDINLDKFVDNHDPDHYSDLVTKSITDIAKFLNHHYDIDLVGNKANFDNGTLIVQEYEFDYIGRFDNGFKNIRLLSVLVHFIKKSSFIL